MKTGKCLSTILLIIPFLGTGAISVSQDNHEGCIYSGRPYNDSVYNGGAQAIPGSVQCEYYDFGGEGVAFHDTDSVNSGSGRLNPPDGTNLNEFRIKEPVDISYTKFRDPPIDNTQYNFAETRADQLYVGWTKPGEWTKYTVNVLKPGSYRLGLMYTSNKGGKISISVNDKDLTGPVVIPSTFVKEDSVGWRQWHHWNYIPEFSIVILAKGQQVITLHTVEGGEMNYDYISFEFMNEQANTNENDK